MRRRFSLGLVAAVVMPLALGACGGPQTAGTAGNGGQDQGALQRPRVAFSSALDAGDVVYGFGLRKMGAKLTTLDDDSAVVAGLSRGDFDFGRVETAQVIQAAQQGAQLKIIYVGATVPEFIVVSRGELKSFESLAGKTLAYHAEGDITELMLRSLVRQKGGERLEQAVNWVVVPESSSRAQALVGGRIDATVLEYADLLTVQNETELNELASWADMKGPAAAVKEEAWVTTESFYASNPQAVRSFVTDMQDSYDRFYADRAAWSTLTHDMIPQLDISDPQLAQLHGFYVDIERYPTGDEPVATPQQWREMDRFFRTAGAYKEDTPAGLVAFDLMN